MTRPISAVQKLHPALLLMAAPMLLCFLQSVDTFVIKLSIPIFNRGSEITTASRSNANDDKEVMEGVQFRPAVQSDKLKISLLMAKHFLQSPRQSDDLCAIKSPFDILKIDTKRFFVAVDTDNENYASQKLYGWTNLQPIGPSVRNPSQFNSRPGSGSIELDIEQELNQEAWEDFENDDLEFPNGFASLPWTKEYREYARASAERREKLAAREKKREDLLRMAERDRLMDKNQLWELRSVFVPEDSDMSASKWQCIENELVRRTLSRHVLLGRNIEDVYVCTLSSRTDWLKEFGFELTSDVPTSMTLNGGLGRAWTSLSENRVVVMKGRKSNSGYSTSKEMD